jgi:hypothetical protein
MIEEIDGIKSFSSQRRPISSEVQPFGLTSRTANFESPIARKVIEPILDKNLVFENNTRGKGPPRRVNIFNCGHPQ